MTDDPKLSNIVPFGKYKGRLIEEALDDPAFLSWAQWALGQAGIRERYPTFCQVIINRGAEPEETPGHNAMQVKFLDDDFCLRFMRHVTPDCDVTVRDKFNAARESNLDALTNSIESEVRLEQNNEAHYTKRIQEISARSETPTLRSNSNHPSAMIIPR